MTTEQNTAYGGNANIYTHIYISVQFLKISETNPLSPGRLKMFLELFVFPGLEIVSNQTIPQICYFLMENLNHSKDSKHKFIIPWSHKYCGLISKTQ